MYLLKFLPYKYLKSATKIINMKMFSSGILVNHEMFILQCSEILFAAHYFFFPSVASHDWAETGVSSISKE